MEYEKNYGGKAPDFSKCAERIFGDWRARQCARKAKYDPDANGNPTTCKIHSSVETAKRKAIAKR